MPAFLNIVLRRDSCVFIAIDVFFSWELDI